jgi:hypothetical protein
MLFVRGCKILASGWYRPAYVSSILLLTKYLNKEVNWIKKGEERRDQMNNKEYQFSKI